MRLFDARERTDLFCTQSLDNGLDENADVFSLNEVEYAIDEDGWHYGGIKGREGIVTQGRTLEEFCLMIEDARRLMDSEDGEDQ